MNEHERRRADTASAESEPRDERQDEVIVAESADETVVEYEMPDAERDGEDDEAALEPAGAGRRVVQINRGLFLAMVTFGALAILALGASTAWLALDRRDNGGDPVIATVNGEQIRRSEYDRAVAQQNGEEVLENLVLERLITSEAKKRNITVDDQETARLLDEQKQQLGGEQAYQSALAQSGLTEEDVTRNLRLRAMLSRMVADQVQVSDEEVDAMYRSNADRYAGQPEAQAKEQIKAGIQRQRESAVLPQFVDQLRTGAKIETHLPGKS